MNDDICRVATVLEMRDHHGHPFYDGGGGGGEGGRGCIVRDVVEPGTERKGGTNILNVLSDFCLHFR